MRYRRGCAWPASGVPSSRTVSRRKAEAPDCVGRSAAPSARPTRSRAPVARRLQDQDGTREERLGLLGVEAARDLDDVGAFVEVDRNQVGEHRPLTLAAADQATQE